VQVIQASPRVTLNIENSVLLFPERKKGGLLGSLAPCLSAAVFLCNPHISKEAASFCSFEGAFLERIRKTFIADLGQSLEARSEGQGGRGKRRFIRRVCPKVEGTDIQAIVAAENAIPHLRGEFVRDNLSTTS
jgi:hypothetical protein